MFRQIRRRSAAALIALIVPLSVLAAPLPVHIVKTDLKPLIRAGMDSPVQFAVLVPHAASASSAGVWSTAGGVATWRYAVAVPTAVSLSFHATNSRLPPGAILVVRGAKTTVSYRARDLRHSELWSRIQPGQALEFTLTVPDAERDKLAFSIVSLQAGYRSLGAGVADHPYYLRLKALQAAATGNASCVTNYECEVTANNTPLAAATMAVVVGNLYQCTGVLINDVPEDNTPYVLTARHCETGQLGGGNPGAASSATVYWDATTPCASTSLGSIYDPGIPTQTGAQTMVEQQDAWLILLDVNPVASDAQFAGFDASGGAVQGGYTIQHAEGYDKQFTAWFGQAAPVSASGVLGTTYQSNFWETVNSVGNVGPGASGSGLINQNNRLVGSLSLGRQSSDPSGYGSCPVASPPTPNGANGVADFTALAAVWNSTADATSSTNPTTLKSLLDPANTGTLVVASMPIADITLSASTEELSIGQSVTLEWNAPTATACTAGGGVSGDGWKGTLAVSGSQSVSESSASVVTYVLSCAYSGGRTAKTTATVSWLGLTPAVNLTGPNTQNTVWTSTPASLSWTSNVSPCSLTGGSLALTNLAASGTVTTTQSTSGDVNYKLICGDSAQNAFSIVTVGYVTPALTFVGTGTDRLLGQTFVLGWNTFGNVCTPSGGAPNDGWSNAEFIGDNAFGSFTPNVTELGTYTYTLTCSTAPYSVQKSFTVTFENNAPYVTASLSSSSVTFSASPADYVTLNWNTNLSSCGISTPPTLPVAYGANPQTFPASATVTPQGSGTYQLQVYCDTALDPEQAAATSALLTLTVLAPQAPTETITFFPSTVVAGQSFSAAYSSTNASDCLLTGGIPGGWWGGSVQSVPPSGNGSESGAAGTYTFGITCSSIDPNSPPVTTQKSLTIEPLMASLAVSATSVTVGQSFTLNWSSANATSCTASGGGANGSPWSGTVATAGTLTQTATTPGTFTYSLMCGTGNVSTAAQQVKVTVTGSSSTSTSTSSGGGHGGGGSLDWLQLSLLTALAAGRKARGRWQRSCGA